MGKLNFWFQTFLVLPLFFIIVALPARAKGKSSLLYSPPTGLYLQPSDKTKRGQLYGPTSPAAMANWNISQWEIPNDLPPFNINNISQNASAKVAFLGNKFILAQNSRDYACIKTYPSGFNLPKEWALFAAPNGAQDLKFPSAILDTKETLADLQSVQLKTTLTLQTAKVLDQQCKVTKAFIVANVVLTDKVSHQTLFYGFGFANYLLKKNGMFFNVAGSKTQNSGKMYFNGFNRESGSHNIYGYGDSVNAAFGEPEITPGQTIAYHVNLLPRLIFVIKQGKRDGMDSNLKNWVLGGFYEGQTITGHVFVETEWSKFSLVLLTH